MAECATNIVDPFRCPGKWELWRQLLSLLPRGRAWQTHEDMVETIETGNNSQVGTFETGLTGLGGEPLIEKLSVMHQFWAAFAELLEDLHQRACALLPEFFCESVAEMVAEWQIDYGFPDNCEPWHTLCDKVRALGGSTCAYLAGLAADRGWSLSCSECNPDSGSRAGCATAGCAKTCGCPGNTIWVTVDLNDSPAYVAPPAAKPARAGASSAGAAVAVNCPPGTEPLQCLIERFKPAHVRAVYIYQ